MSFYVGLDLGQMNDYTAIAVVQETADGLHVRHLGRFRHTLYPDVADRVKNSWRGPSSRARPTWCSRLLWPCGESAGRSWRRFIASNPNAATLLYSSVVSCRKGA